MKGWVDQAHEFATWTLIVLGFVAVLMGGLAIVRILLRP